MDTDPHDWLTNRGEEMDNHCLTATQAFNFLIKATSDVTNHRSMGVNAGIIKDWMSDDEAIAFVFALQIVKSCDFFYSPRIAMSMLMNYCRPDIADAYEDFILQLLQKADSPMSPEKLKDKQFDVLIDIDEFATEGKRLGYKSSYNPFKEPFSTQWKKILE